MNANEKTIYIKIDRNVLVNSRTVTLGEIASITGSNPAMVRKLKQKNVCTFARSNKMQRKVFSILEIIKLIQIEYPNAQIENEGETDFIIEYKENPIQNKAITFIKIVLLCIIIFFGGAFTIMAFNNDIGITELFGRLYYQVMGVNSDGMTEIEFFYCVGLGVGIIVFFNHFGKKKITPDPTPIQVQMRKYEKDVDDAYIENSGRGGSELDVD